MKEVISRIELLRIIKKFLEDKNRGISQELFAELAGMSKEHLLDVFIRGVYPLSERVQRRVSRAYEHFRDGEVAIMQNKDRTKFLEYRRQPKPRMTRSMGLEVQNGAIKLRIGVKNRVDYEERDIDEQLRG
jgi:hypothetical protein